MRQPMILTSSKIAAAIAWLLFWSLMVLVAVQDYRRDGGTAWWQPLPWETSSALVATCLLLLQRRLTARYDHLIATPWRWFALQPAGAAAVRHAGDRSAPALPRGAREARLCGLLRRLHGGVPAGLNEALFPVYILHQSVIVVLAQGMQPLRLAPGLEALLLVVLTLCLSFGGYELLRRVGPLRLLFRLAPRRRIAAPDAQAPSASQPPHGAAPGAQAAA